MSLQLCGFLRKEKRGGFLSGFVERWFVVSKDNHFEYYADSSAAAPSDRFPLASIASVQPDEETHDMLITASHRTFRLRAESKADLDRWVTGLREAIAAAAPMRATSAPDKSFAALAPLQVLKPRSAAPGLSPTRPRDARAVSRTVDERITVPAATTGSASILASGRAPPPAMPAPLLPSHMPAAMKMAETVLHGASVSAPARAKPPPPPSMAAPPPPPPHPPAFAPTVQSPRCHVPSLNSDLHHSQESSNSLPATVISQRAGVWHRSAPVAAIMAAATVPVVSITAGVAADRNWLDDNFDD